MRQSIAQPSMVQLFEAVRAAMAAKRPSEAEGFLRHILALDPNSPDALMALAGILLATNRADEAGELAERAIRVNSSLGPPHFQLGQCRLRQGRLEEAVAELETAAQISPNVAPVQHALGRASQAMGRLSRAEECYRKAIALDPASGPSYAELGQIQMARGDQEGGIASFKHAAKLQPNSARGQFLLGRALIEGEQFAEGEQLLRSSIQLDRGFADAFTLLARSMQQQGRFAEAEKVLQELGTSQEDESQGFYLRVTGRTITDQDRPMIERVEAIADSLEPGARRAVAYGLGKSFDDLGEFERAMRHFDIANRLSQDRNDALGLTFDPGAMVKYDDETIARFSVEELSRRMKDGNESQKPVFIIGMGRSGTTLLEQILSSHPDIRAAGELGTWSTLMSDDFDRAAEADKLLAKLDGLAPNAARVTIKTPQNFLVVGQILSVFPNCRFLHCRRNPVDTCLSTYTTSFLSGPEFAHDRSSLVMAYREYRRLMDHWRAIVPSERIMDIDYEQIVADREPILRDVLAFLGLTWSDDVMRHESNQHAISTPSVWQARQPIFTRSVERWRRYAPWLGPLLELQDLT